MLKAILFDMDGVIVDSEPLHKKAYYKMFDGNEIFLYCNVYYSVRQNVIIFQTDCITYTILLKKLN